MSGMFWALVWGRDLAVSKAGGLPGRRAAWVFVVGDGQRKTREVLGGAGKEGNKAEPEGLGEGLGEGLL